MGIVELLALLMTIAGFGVDENPNAPTATEVLATAPARADYMVHVDLVAIVPNNYKILTGLPKHPSVTKEPKARDALEAVIGQLEAGRGMIKGMLGMDLVTDLTSATLWVNVPDAGDPNFLLVVRGNLPADMIEMVAGTAGMPTKQVHGRTTISPEPSLLVGVSPGGYLLAGSAAWVKPRLARKWKRKKNSAMTRGAKPLLDAKPAIVFASAPSRRWIRKLGKEMTAKDEALALDVLTGHKFLGISFLHDGLEWTAVARTKTGYRRALQASEGVLELMRSFHFASRGLARVALAALPSYRGLDEVVDAIVRHEDEILELVEATTGDGNFEVEIERAERKKTVHVRARGKELSDVLPAAGLLPVAGGAAGFLLMSGDADHAMEPASATPATVAP